MVSMAFLPSSAYLNRIARAKTVNFPGFLESKCLGILTSVINIVFICLITWCPNLVVGFFFFYQLAYS